MESRRVNQCQRGGAALHIGLGPQASFSGSCLKLGQRCDDTMIIITQTECLGLVSISMLSIVSRVRPGLDYNAFPSVSEAAS